ncbi:hypothetical protein L226DRAFT_86183 [Lentinus tigrinus ALCF2SS1-7]|uniref:uncharacterized protein n=1 Tax=Lentinus tigrinus ALCF2SS1-7 TaxID=1328758 RepID=UPI001166155D|nr:hypothetical protein L226DRAFT_86183 [Lentinus tigrinus ALCF2SS1-7]
MSESERSRRCEGSSACNSEGYSRGKTSEHARNSSGSSLSRLIDIMHSRERPPPPNPSKGAHSSCVRGRGQVKHRRTGRSEA